jgi:hypothetical protein
MAKIIQWKCRGIRANFEERDVAICLQEPQVSDTYILDNNLHVLLSKLPHIPILATGHMVVQVFWFVKISHIV